MQVSFFEILRSYHELKIAKQVGAKANSLFMAILTKMNNLRFPESFTIYNSELLDLSGLTENELYPARNKLTQFVVNGHPIVFYQNNGKKKPGSYRLNYEGFRNYFQDYFENQGNGDSKHDSKPESKHDSKPGSSISFSTITQQNKTRETDPRVREIVQAYEQVCGPLQGEPGQLMTLVDYLHQGIETEVVIHAIRKSSQAHHPARYADSILRDYQRKGVKTLQQALEQSAPAREKEATHGDDRTGSDGDADWTRIEENYFAVSTLRENHG